MTDALPGFGLLISHVDVTFAGLKALDDVSFVVAPETIHAVIGPNGAGKSTLFNVISGIYRPSAGSVSWDGNTLTGVPVHNMASHGIARTFQNLAGTATETAEEVLLQGRHHLTRSGLVSDLLRTPRQRAELRASRETVAELADVLGLGERLQDRVGTLSYGERKRLELGRALAMRPRLLLVDEPAAGLNDSETAEMAELLVTVRTAIGATILLVEHDMGMVMSIADRITVLDFGHVIADGTPHEVRVDDAVLDAYLGAHDSSLKGALP